MKLIERSWGLSPWWQAVWWWWGYDRAKAIRVFFGSGLGALAWSIKHRGWEASDRITHS